MRHASVSCGGCPNKMRPVRQRGWRKVISATTRAWEKPSWIRGLRWLTTTTAPVRRRTDAQNTSYRATLGCETRLDAVQPWQGTRQQNSPHAESRAFFHVFWCILGKFRPRHVMESRHVYSTGRRASTNAHGRNWRGAEACVGSCLIWTLFSGGAGVPLVAP